MLVVLGGEFGFGLGFAVVDVVVGPGGFVVEPTVLGPGAVVVGLGFGPVVVGGAGPVVVGLGLGPVVTGVVVTGGLLVPALVTVVVLGAVVGLVGGGTELVVALLVLGPGAVVDAVVGAVVLPVVAGELVVAVLGAGIEGSMRVKVILTPVGVTEGTATKELSRPRTPEVLVARKAPETQVELMSTWSVEGVMGG